MKSILIMDYKNIFKSTKFKIITIIIIIIPIIAFLLSCKFYYGLPIDFIRSGNEENFINGMVSRHIKQWFILILPLLATLLCSDIYSSQFNSGIYKSILTRCSKKDYILGKVIAVFTITAIVVFISLLINQIFSWIVFPVEAIDNARGIATFDIGYSNFDENGFLDLMRVNNIYLYNFSFFILFSVVSGLYGIIALAISFFVKDTKISVILMFIIYFGIYILFITNGIESYHINYYLDAFNQGNEYFFIWMLMLITVPSSLIIFKLKIKDEI